MLGIPTCVPSVELKPGKLSDGKPISTVTKEDYPARKKKAYGTKPKKKGNNDQLSVAAAVQEQTAEAAKTDPEKVKLLKLLRFGLDGKSPEQIKNMITKLQPDNNPSGGVSFASKLCGSSK